MSGDGRAAAALSHTTDTARSVSEGAEAQHRTAAGRGRRGERRGRGWGHTGARKKVPVDHNFVLLLVCDTARYMTSLTHSYAAHIHGVAALLRGLPPKILLSRFNDDVQIPIKAIWE